MYISNLLRLVNAFQPSTSGTPRMSTPLKLDLPPENPLAPPTRLTFHCQHATPLPLRGKVSFSVAGRLHRGLCCVRAGVLLCWSVMLFYLSVLLKGDSVVVRPLTWVVNAEERAVMWPRGRLFSACASRIKAAHSAGLRADVLNQCLQDSWFSQHSSFYLCEKWGR